MADMSYEIGQLPAVASVSVDDVPLRTITTRKLRQLTSLTSAAFDPIWTEDDQVIFTSFESLSFSIRHLPDVDSLLTAPKREQVVDLAQTGTPWAYSRIGLDDGIKFTQYKKKYKLDLASGAISQSAVLGTLTGAMLAFSDMMGDDYLYVSIFNTASSQRDFIKSLSFTFSRYQLNRRTNLGYGIYRYSGQRYDRGDPDAPASIPVYYETLWGGFGSVSYPISKFRRVEFATSLAHSSKEVPTTLVFRDALLLSNSISLVHDNALYWWNGPIQGWRGQLTAAYTTDILYSNVSYFTLVADVRHYLRLFSDVTFATWLQGRWNQGREARRFVMGGSWDIRGYCLYCIRGTKTWMVINELRFPLINSPSAFIPFLAPFGVANLRGALFLDAAHAWNEAYDRPDPVLLAGETLGSAGFGFRMNVLGGFVLRYDIGWRYRNGFKNRGTHFRQFFFGWDF